MLWLGNYRKNGGSGLRPLGSDLRLGPPEAKIANASFAVWAANSGIAYFVDEQEVGRVSAWRRTGQAWAFVGAIETGGSLPCFLTLSADRRWLAAANYGDGSIALIKLDPMTGRILDISDMMRVDGRGVDPERQKGAHAHCAVFDEADDILYHVDLGLDRVFRHRIERGRCVGAEIAIAAPPGSGPRHLAFHPGGGYALLLTELSAELMLFARTETGLQLCDRMATAPEPCQSNLGGHLDILPDGTILVTNRGHDSLAAFVLADGRLQRRGWVETGAASPRHFHVGSDEVIVAHEEGESLSIVPLPTAGSAGEGPRQIAAAPGAAFIFSTPDP